MVGFGSKLYLGREFIAGGVGIRIMGDVGGIGFRGDFRFRVF